MTVVPLTPGLYILQRRQASGLTHDDVALRIETDPPVAAARRAEWLRAIEVELLPVRTTTAVALAAIPELAIDLATLAELIDADARFGGEPMLVRFRAAPTLAELD